MKYLLFILVSSLAAVNSYGSGDSLQPHSGYFTNCSGASKLPEVGEAYKSYRSLKDYFRECKVAQQELAARCKPFAENPNSPDLVDGYSRARRNSAEKTQNAHGSQSNFLSEKWRGPNLASATKALKAEFEKIKAQYGKGDPAQNAALKNKLTEISTCQKSIAEVRKRIPAENNCVAGNAETEMACLKADNAAKEAYEKRRSPMPEEYAKQQEIEKGQARNRAEAEKKLQPRSTHTSTITSTDIKPNAYVPTCGPVLPEGTRCIPEVGSCTPSDGPGCVERANR